MISPHYIGGLIALSVNGMVGTRQESFNKEACLLTIRNLSTPDHKSTNVDQILGELLIVQVRLAAIEEVFLEDDLAQVRMFIAAAFDKLRHAQPACSD